MLEINEIQIQLDSQISQLKIENIQLKQNYDKAMKKLKIYHSNDNFEFENMNVKPKETSKSVFIKYKNSVS
jgi:hypothetical protein